MPLETERTCRMHSQRVKRPWKSIRRTKSVSFVEVNAISRCRNHEEAIRDYQEVIKSHPENSAAKQAMQKCREDIKAYQKKEKQLYANIFEKMAKQSEKVSFRSELRFIVVLKFRLNPWKQQRTATKKISRNRPRQAARPVPDLLLLCQLSRRDIQR